MTVDVLNRRPMRCLKPWGRTPDGIVILEVGPTVRASDGKPIRCWKLNSTAATTWLLCDGNRTVAEILAAVAERFDQDEEKVAPDVLDLLFQLSENGMVVLDYEPFF